MLSSALRSGSCSRGSMPESREPCGVGMPVFAAALSSSHPFGPRRRLLGHSRRLGSIQRIHDYPAGTPLRCPLCVAETQVLQTPAGRDEVGSHLTPNPVFSPPLGDSHSHQGGKGGEVISRKLELEYHQDVHMLVACVTSSNLPVRKKVLT